ncbi:hypothetical protein [Oceanidesulfovibrio indonesiensis]|nr:hypothetical protein [Oceanidesulfovibrio indonesiensis]
MNSISHIMTSVLLAATVLLAGCSEGGVGRVTLDATLDSTGKTIKGLYKDYVEPQPQVVLDAKEFGENEERKLAYLLMPVDEKVWELIKFVDGEDTLPTEDWFRRLFERFQWISGVMVLDEKGETLFQHPIDYNRSVDVEALLALGDSSSADVRETQDVATAEEIDEAELALDAPETEVGTLESEALNKSWQDHSLRGYAGNSTMGPEVYLVQPYYENNDFSGLTTIYFDPRNLLEYCPEPDELMILTSEGVIWSAGYPEAASELATLPWDDVLKRRVYGVATAAGGEYYWLGRHMGNFYLIYATAVPNEALDDVLESSREPQTLETPEAETAP